MSRPNHFDSRGQYLKEGDRVVFLDARESLLRGLPAADRVAIKGQVGKEMAVEGFDDYGHVELEFFEQGDEYIVHTIWVEPDCLKKIIR